MRYFERQALDEKIQNQLDAKTSKDWSKLTEDQRTEIVEKLTASQKHICAYCECEISIENRHIEHFIEQHNDTDKIFHYSNMLLSCQGAKDPISRTEIETVEEAHSRRMNTSCGHKKEKGRHKHIEIDYSLLLNPTNNVSALFSYVHGEIEPSRICSVEQIKEVEYTRKRLSLDADRLINKRKEQISLVNQRLYGLTDAQQAAFIKGLLDESQDVLDPYFSTLKDNFGFMLMP
jgi:uncharacterized protein (TIGR02646 family)